MGAIARVSKACVRASAQLSRSRLFARAVFRFIAVAPAFLKSGIMPSYQTFNLPLNRSRQWQDCVPANLPLIAYCLRLMRSTEVESIPLRHHVIETDSPSPLSSALLCPAPPVNTRTPIRLPCRIDAIRVVKNSDSYLRHSHRSTVFDSPANKAGTGNHSGNYALCAVIHVHHYNRHVGRTPRASRLFRYDIRLPPEHRLQRS